MDALKIMRYFLLLSLHWIPRILGLLFAIFVALFSFDVFGQNAGFWKTLAAFLIHNIPSVVLIVTLILSWKWSWIGGVVYTILGVTYLLLFSGGNKSALIYLPLFITGTLFTLNWLLRRNIDIAREAYREE